MSLVGIGLIATLFKNNIFTILFIIILFSLQYIIRGAYYTLLKRYLNSFSSSTMSTKIYSVNILIESLLSTIACFFASLLLDHTSTDFAITILGCIFTILFVFILDYMKDKIGLKPEEYKKSDIYFTEVH